jgi:DNA-binding NarL/FixJ family response regulator
MARTIARNSGGAASIERCCSTKERPLRILIIDSRPLVREGLAAILHREPDLRVCGIAPDEGAAVAAVPLGQPDVVTVALEAGQCDRLEIIKDFRARFPKIKVIVVSTVDDVFYAERALRAGALGYLAEDDASSVAEAIRQTARGELFISQKVAARMAARFVAHPTARRVPVLATLSDREAQVFELLGEGCSRRQIAERLHLDVNTVETYRARIKDKLRLGSARELFQYAIRARRGLTSMTVAA